MFPWSPQNEKSTSAQRRRRGQQQSSNNQGQRLQSPPNNSGSHQQKFKFQPDMKNSDIPKLNSSNFSAPKDDPNLFSIRKKSLEGNSTASEEFMQKIHNQRLACSASGFEFNLNRRRKISSAEKILPSKSGVVYWMSRDQRVQDNWAFIYAQKLAIEHKVPLYVCFCVVPEFLGATIRQYCFMLKGLKEVERECKDLGIQFTLLTGYAKDVLPDFVNENNIGAVVTDFSPLREPLQWLSETTSSLPNDVPFYQVDAHNIVPCWVHGEQEHRAYLMRKRIQSKKHEYLTEFPLITSHPYQTDPSRISQPVDWDAVISSLQVDRTVPEVEWAIPGTSTAFRLLENFCKHRLLHYLDDRNNPTKPCTSEMSPWQNFGQISVHRCILVVEQYRKQYPEAVEKYVDEAVTWREMTENFCFYNPKYDAVDGALDWSIATLRKHSTDKRTYVYNLEDFENGKTHDDIWNAAQIQMVEEGKMHCFLRMYWAKKILEWSENPEAALKTALYLNDRYELDGRDPNGYGGCAWAILGVHDREFGERDIYGRVRYMSYRGCEGKFNVSHFTSHYKR